MSRGTPTASDAAPDGATPSSQPESAPINRLRRTVRLSAFGAEDLGGPQVRFYVTDRVTGYSAPLDEVEIAVAHGLQSLAGDLTSTRLHRYAELQTGQGVDTAAVDATIDRFTALGLLEEFRSDAELLALQQRGRRAAWDRAALGRLNAMLARLATVPFYEDSIAERGADLECLDDLRRYPLVSKEDLRQQLPRFQPMSYTETPEDHPVAWAQSSGSTGDRAAVVALERNVWENFTAAPTFVLDHDGRVTDPRVCVLQTPICSGTECHMDMAAPYERRIDLEPGEGGDAPTRGGMLVLNSYLSPTVAEADRLDENLADMARFDPHILAGNSSYLATLARHLLRTGASPPPLQYILVTGELFSALHRRLIERAFGVPVRDMFGSSDGGTVTAVQCANGRHHVVPSHLLELLVGDRPAEPGEVGRIVITTLDRKLTPLLRYETGDLGRACPPCDCDRGHTPVFSKVEGRLVDLIRDSRGQLLTPREVDDHLAGHPASIGVFHYALTQHTKQRYTLAFVPSDEGDPTHTAAALQVHLQTLLGPGAELRVKRQRELFPTNTGKFQLSHSEIPVAPVELTGRPGV